MQYLDNVEIICYDRKIDVPKSLRRRVLYWYHFYLKHLGGSGVLKITEIYVIGKALSRKRGCSLKRARYANSSKI